MSNKEFIKDFLGRAVRHDTDERTCVKNISTEDFEYWYDPQKVASDGCTMSPKRSHVLLKGEISQFPKGLAFDIGISLAKKLAYERYKDKGLSNEALWMELLEQIVFPVGYKIETVNPIEEAKKIISSPELQVTNKLTQEQLEKIGYNDLSSMLKQKGGTWKMGMGKDKVIEELLKLA